MNVSKLLLPDVGELLVSDPSQVRELADELHAADLADLAGALPEEDAVRLLSALPLATSVKALDQLDGPKRAALFVRFAPELAAQFANEMSADERADLFAALPDELRTQILGRMEREEVRDVQKLLAYPETSAGGLMTTDFVALNPTMTVEQAIAHVRKTAEEMETIIEAYSVDPNGTLVGAVSLRDLVLAKPGKSVADLMDPQVISVEAETDQEEVAKLFARYDLLVLPVIDRSRRLIGIVTIDDIVDVQEEEATEDIQRLGAVEPTELPYFETPFWTFVRKRAPWLVILFIEELFTGTALRHYHDQLQAMIVLMFYVPLIISSGGNSGSQSATIVIRGLIVGEITVSDALRVLVRELGMGIALGLILGLVGVGRAAMWGDPWRIALVVGLSLVAVVLVGCTVGALLPLLLRKLRQDPTVSSTPFIASLVDVVGLVVYFNIAIALGVTGKR